ncbi:HAUS augmin-like complex subunit 2 isoform X1 [Biomphalaria glabrata]|uniref:Uncharacterized protein LOC106072322 n=1 Tax=Biomphalaria glabrata TaxID=6526 RepID=A0A2C9LLR5_BIOGL|nr:uncharacterized protein LOC106072322 [Biomphalaria glabrata]KAI8742004.1 AUGMIN subunit 2 isoform X1 [Biomphalaria glabrata]KAI8765737.1 AUGMIN subunit 2-like isoform X1 [Biomphalaria glabrata]
MEKQDNDSIDQASFNIDLHESNPWDHDDDNINNLRNFLIKANQLGFDTMRNQTKISKALKELSSSQIIAQQKEITQKNKTLLKAKYSIRKHIEEKETSDVLHLNLIEERINTVKQLCTDLDTVLQNTELLVNRLQKPFVGSYLKIDAAYHRHASELFMQLVPTLNDLNFHLENLTWMANNDFSAAQLEPLLKEIQSRAASLQTTYHTLSQIRKGIQKLNHSSDILFVMDQSADSSLATPRKT